MSMRRCFLLLALAAFVIAGGAQALATLQQQRAQISVNVQVNVTPAVAYNGGAPRIAVSMAARAHGSAPMFDFQIPTHSALQFQATTQSALRVQAVVSPNPNATLLYYNNPQVVINQTAGTTVTYKCAYTITVDRTSASIWNLSDGLSNDFSTGFPGSDLANNTYVQGGTPNPAATPFVVYPDNNDNWYKRESATTPETYCVDLALTIPSSTAGGAYSTNAVYTLSF